MIDKIILKSGSSETQPKTELNTTPITIFVGPNNSGKSKILSEIHNYCLNGNRNANNLILEQIIYTNNPEERVDEIIEKMTLQPKHNERVNPGHIIFGNKRSRQQVQPAQLKSSLLTPNTNSHLFCSWFLKHETIILNGKNRIDMVKEQPGGDLQAEPTTSFQTLFRDNSKREEVRRIIYDAFNEYFVIDPTHLGKLRIKFSKEAPIDERQERGIHEDAVAFHSSAQMIDHLSDGVKAFTGMVTEIIAGDPKILLIDEPEAFLHPSLSYKLGKEISNITIGTDKRIFVSTHSPSFLMGCIQSGAPINVVRLTYRNNIATSRILPNDEILRLMRNPLLRSSGVLQALFYENVIVTEADSDRAFYQEINDRLLKFKPEWGIHNCLFLNAQNKQTTKVIVTPLRKLGIPTASIVDIDILKEGGSVWTSYLASGYIPDATQPALCTYRSTIKTEINQAGKNLKKDGGIDILEDSTKEAADLLLNQLAEFGLFVVRKGELESWLLPLQITGHGSEWLIKMFEKMEEDPTSPTYVKPEEDDVWGFIKKINDWFCLREKKGIPK